MSRPRIVFIGAGSFGFTRTLVRDLLTFETMRDAHLVLMDVDKQRLTWIEKAIRMIVEKGNYPATIEATTDRRKALKGADCVLCTILAGDVDVWRHDIEIPKKYKINTNVGDTRGPSGIFRALRTIPVMLDICRDMEKVCPNAVLLNYTNPMAMLCHAMDRVSPIRVTGLCHSVQGTAKMIARWIKKPFDEITFLCAGVNHLAWFVKYEHNGKDAYPLIRKAMKRKAVYEQEVVRNEMFLHLGYYVTESSGHNSEYNWWFRKRPDLIKKYCKDSANAGWNPGAYAFILKAYLQRKKTWKKSIQDWLKKGDVQLERGHEYAAYIMNAVLGGDAFTFNGNVANTGLVTNLPAGACVEVPVLADRRGFNAMHAGALPAAVLPLTNLTATVEMMAVEASLTGDPTLAFQAIAHDPLTAAVLSLAETKKMVAEMFKKNRRWLPQFKNIKI